jgi:hypothetical protein
MSSRKAITSVLHNFLGTFSSRYSDYQGYWLFGFIVSDLERAEVDLMSNTDLANSPWEFARRHAQTMFMDQVAKARLDSTWIREANLQMTKSPESCQTPVNGYMCAGNKINLVARAVLDNAREYRHCIAICVAPHDPSVERRSTRAK